MAKKRKEKTEEEPEFKLPKFDEGKFLNKERRNVKTLFISFIVGFVVALISFGFWSLLSGSIFRWELILLLGVFSAPWLKYLFLRLDIDLTDFGRRGWFGSYAIYFFTWLVILIVLVNPPFYDDESPHIEVVLLPEIQELGGTVNIVAHILDNVGLERNGINFSIVTPNGTTYSPDFTFTDNIFEYTYENPENMLGDHSFKIQSTDVNGHSTEESGIIKYSNNVIVLTTPASGSKLNSYTPIEFQIDPEAYDPIPFIIIDKKYTMDMRVFYKIDNGSDINVSRLDLNNRELYRSSADFKGWQKNKNVTLNAFVEVTYYFVNKPQEFSNIIKDTTTYTFETINDDGIGLEENLIPPDPRYKLNAKEQPENKFNYYLAQPRAIAATPGFGTLIFIISLVGAILIIKYRKKEHKK
jgi:hypothetical protein